MKRAALVLATIAATAPAEARSARQAPPPNSYAVLDPLLTPSGVNPSAELALICNSTSKDWRDPQLCRDRRGADAAMRSSEPAQERLRPSRIGGFRIGWRNA